MTLTLTPIGPDVRAFSTENPPSSWSMLCRGLILLVQPPSGPRRFADDGLAAFVDVSAS